MTFRLSESVEKLRKKFVLRPLLDLGRHFLIVVVAVFFVLEYFSPWVQPNQKAAFREKAGEFLSLTQSLPEPKVEEILRLADLIRWVSTDPLPENKALKYAALISHASEKFGVRALEIIALITAESGFKETSVNSRTGDYGLGQINWKHWGKHNGLTTQDLLDPSVNIYMTCQVYKYFGQDFGKYHRGNGIKDEIYVLNLKSILSSLKAYLELNARNTL